MNEFTDPAKQASLQKQAPRRQMSAGAFVFQLAILDLAPRPRFVVR